MWEAIVYRRMRVVVPGFLLGLCLSTCCVCSLQSRNKVATDRPDLTALVILGPAAGPFAEPLAFLNYSLLRMFALGLPLLALISLHPIYPHPATGLISGMALATWYLLGFSNTYYGV
jgi:hypothetical protein